MRSELFKRILSSIILIPLVIIIIIKGSFYLNLFLTICFFIILFEWHMMSKNKNYYFIGIFFLIGSFLSIYTLSNLNNSKLIFLFILLICVSTDIGGYIFGNIFKGPKLTNISPKKTYSGVLGGFLFSILFTFFFSNTNYFFLDKPGLSMKMLMLIILISSVSQLGDIVVSYFKRLSNIKDTGSIIPGHGGLLDRADGMIFAFPFSYIVLSTNLFKII